MGNFLDFKRMFKRCEVSRDMKMSGIISNKLKTNKMYFINGMIWFHMLSKILFVNF